MVALAAVVTTAEAPDFKAAKGFQVFDIQTKLVDANNPAAGSVTSYVEVNPQRTRSRVWIRNDSEYWLIVKWVKICMGSVRHFCFYYSPPDVGDIGQSYVLATCLRHTDAQGCGKKDYYMPPHTDHSWQLDQGVWWYDEDQFQYVTHHVGWSTRKTQPPEEWLGPVGCVCYQ